MAAAPAFVFESHSAQFDRNEAIAKGPPKIIGGIALRSHRLMAAVSTPPMIAAVLSLERRMGSLHREEIEADRARL